MKGFVAGGDFAKRKKEPAAEFESAAGSLGETVNVAAATMLIKTADTTW